MDKLKLENIAGELWKVIAERGPGVVLAIITLIAGWYIINFVMGYIKKLISKNIEDSTMTTFLTRMVRLLFRSVLLISVMSMVGIETSSLIAMLGAVGLAVGLALQGSLSNFAGGVVILVFKPFKVGDMISAQSETGVVQKLDIFHTHLLTADNKRVVIPNGQLANGNITNFTSEGMRRVDYAVGISYGSDIRKARETILSVLQNDPRILQEPAPYVVLTELADSSLNLSARAFVKTEDYFPVFWEGLENIKLKLDEASIEIPFPQRDVHVYNHTPKG